MTRLPLSVLLAQPTQPVNVLTDEEVRKLDKLAREKQHSAADR